jgi:ammonia channel protein AmtB
MMHSMVAVAIIGIQWPLFGYSVARCKVLLVGAAATVSCPKQSLGGVQEYENYRGKP